MTQTQCASTMPFAKIIARTLTTTLPDHVLRLAPEGTLEAYAFRILETPLVYLLNEGRLLGELAGDTPEDEYTDFTEDAAGALNKLHAHFPRHWRRWLEVKTRLAETFDSILEHFDQDTTSLTLLLAGSHTADPPSLLHIRPLGDVHPQGVVCEVETSLGIVYHKPRPAGNENFLSILTKWLEDHASEGTWLGLQFPKLADCGDHTWVSPVQHQPLADRASATAYYRRAGHLLGISHLVNITDLHHENIIATATHPVPIDLETLMSVFPRSAPEQTDATDEVMRLTTQSPAATGLLPLGTSFQELGGDISGLTADQLRVRRRVLDKQGRSDMRYISIISEVTSQRNCPILDGHPVSPEEHVDDIIEGFATVLNIAINHREDLISLIRRHAENIRVRVIARMTNDYSVALAGLSRVSGNTDPERIMSMLREHSAGLSASMVDSEQEQLRRWMIPHFWAAADERIIRDPWGRPTGELSITPSENVVTKINGLTAKRINHQVSLVRLAFRRPEKIVLPLSDGLTVAGTNTFDEFEETHLKALCSQATTGADGTVNWPTLAVDNRDQLTVQPLLGGMYRGVAGVAELLATARHGDMTWRPLAQALLSTLRVESEAIDPDTFSLMSFYHGPASRLAAATHLGSAFSLESSWVRDSHDRLLKAWETTSAEAPLDMLDGAAGLISALRHHHHPRAVSICRDLGHRIRLAATDGWDSPKICPHSRNASFAHDASGMGTGLLVAADKAKEVDLVEAWRDAWAFENTFKLSEGEGWNDARTPGESLSTHWCHGLAGIALARAIWFQLVFSSTFLQTVIRRQEINQIRQELEETATLLVRHLGDTGSPSLCHGISGGALVLDFAGRLLNKPHWRTHAEDLVLRAGATLARCPWLWGEHNVRDFGITTGPGGLILARHLLNSPRGGVGPLLPHLPSLEET